QVGGIDEFGARQRRFEALVDVDVEAGEARLETDALAVELVLPEDAGEFLHDGVGIVEARRAHVLDPAVEERARNLELRDLQRRLPAGGGRGAGEILGPEGARS